MKKFCYSSLWFLFILLLGCMSCSKKNAAPEGILTIEQMIPVITETQLAEASLSVQNLHADSAKQRAADYYNYIYEKNGVTKETFEKSLNYYIEHPNEFDQIYTEVITELSKLEAQEAK